METLPNDKFKFALREVEFVGYKVGWPDYHPSDNMFKSIKESKMPAQPTITDVWLRFGLVNQLNPFLASSEIMSPFRDLLRSSNTNSTKQVYWDNELECIFEKAKLSIIDMAKNGLAYFDCTKRTALVTEWSKKGIGFILLQKHCDCDNDVTILCCKEGWKMALCGSRFLQPSEANYAPIEGELLAVTWGLKKCRMFLQGCQKFYVFVDHKPLLKILGDKALGEIDNPILSKYKEKTLDYRFNVKYTTGLNNYADLFSRNPVETPDEDDVEESREINVIMNNMGTLSLASILITPETIKDVSKTDKQYQEILEKVKNNSFSNSAYLENANLKDFYKIKDRLSITDDCLMYTFESNYPHYIIPKELQNKVLQS